MQEVKNFDLGGVWSNQTPNADAGSKPAPAPAPLEAPEFLTEKATARLLDVGVRKLHQLRSEEWFPAAIELGPRALRWRRSELLEALANRAPRRTVQREPGHFQEARARRKGAAL